MTRPATARPAFVLLFALMMIDFADRQVLVAAFPQLRLEWGLDDTELGALVSVLNLTIALAALPVAVRVDRTSRVRAIAVMGAIWSTAAAASGFAQSYVQLLAARIGVGAGEAGYGPAGGAHLASVFPPARRATVLGAFQAAGPLGTVAGTALGGVVAAEWGWRWAVGILALPGLLLALAMLRIRDHPAVRPERPGPWATVTSVVRARSALGAVVGGVLLLIVASTLYTWLPTHLERAYGLGPRAAGGLAATVLLAGVLGTAGAAVVADRLARRNARLRLLAPAGTALATAALLSIAFGLLPPGGGQLVFLLAGAAAVTAAVGPVAAVVIDVVHPGLRAGAVSVLVVAQNLFGLAVGPVLGGALADLAGLTVALTVIPLLGIGAAAAFWSGARRYPTDLAAVAALTGPIPTRAA